MSVFGSSGTKTFEKLLDKATSQLQLETDWQTILQMCDVVRQGDVQPKYAVALLRKKLTSENVNTVMYSLQSLESIVKNCGSKVHEEIATREFMDTMKSLISSKPEPIKLKVLELIQCWAYAFRKNPNYKVVEDYYNAIKIEGHQYPVFKEADAMFDVEQAPEWKDDTNCFRCRAEFSTFLRKHHCRCCGQIFCANCSAKTSPIPKFGIEKEVRVCDVCYDKLKSGLSTSAPAEQNGLPIEYLNSPLAKQNQKPVKQEKTEEEFEEELQLALALSQSEQEEKEKQRQKFKPKDEKSNNQNIKILSNEKSNNPTLFPTKILNQTQIDDNESELNKYLAKSTVKKSDKIMQQQLTGPSPPPSAPFVETKSNDEKGINEIAEETNHEMYLFVDEVKKLLEIFITRMKSDSLRGRTIQNDTAVQSLFLQLQQMQPKLLEFMKLQEDAREYFESLQDKLTQLKDAREALNALRHDYFERKRREAEERERIRQIQITQKLQYMRQQKQYYYQYQNEMNLKRLQDQERDLQLRLEQQRQLVLLRDQKFISGLGLNPNQAFPNMYGQQAQYDQQNYSIQPPMAQMNIPQVTQYTAIQNPTGVHQNYSQTSTHQQMPITTNTVNTQGNVSQYDNMAATQIPTSMIPTSVLNPIQSTAQPQHPVQNPMMFTQAGLYNMNTLNYALPNVLPPQLQQQLHASQFSQQQISHLMNQNILDAKLDGPPQPASQQQQQQQQQQIQQTQNFNPTSQQFQNIILPPQATQWQNPQMIPTNAINTQAYPNLQPQLQSQPQQFVQAQIIPPPALPKEDPNEVQLISFD